MAVDDVRCYYDQDPEMEWSRFEEPGFCLEFATGKHLIEKYLPAIGRACDIGAGAGRYTEFLATRGARVTCVDLSPEQLRAAQRHMAENDLSVERYLEASATDLSELESDSFDFGLMMGPLYHLVERADRLQALVELRRILVPGGLAVITYFGHLGMLRLGISDLARRYEDVSQIERLLNPTSFTDFSGFPDSHFSSPEHIKAEVEEAGFNFVSYASAQGFAGGIRRDMEWLHENWPKAFANIIDVSVRYCEDERFRDLGQHLHCIVCAD